MQDELVVKSKEKNVLQEFDVIFCIGARSVIQHVLLYPTKNISDLCHPLPLSKDIRKILTIIYNFHRKIVRMIKNS